MGKAAKRERQKTNKALREEEAQRKAQRKKVIRIIQGVALVLIIPVVVLVSMLINNATDPDVYTAKIKVAIDGEKSLENDGMIEVALDHAYSKNSVDHFVRMASNGLYDGLTWHRVVKDFVIQGGDPNGDGSGSIGSDIQAELPRRDPRKGDLLWAKAPTDPPGTAGSQFFIVTGEGQSLSALGKTQLPDGSQGYQYGFLGHVTKGISLAEQIEKLSPESNDGAPTKKALIVSIEVFKNGKKIKAGDLIAPTTTSTSTTLPSDLTTTESTPQS